LRRRRHAEPGTGQCHTHRQRQPIAGFHDHSRARACPKSRRGVPAFNAPASIPPLIPWRGPVLRA
jgi:hypothetical protein